MIYSKTFSKTGFTNKTDQKKIDRIALDYLNNFVKLNKNTLDLDLSIIDNEIKRLHTWLDFLRNKKPLTDSKRLEIKFNCLIQLSKIKHLNGFKEEQERLKK